MAIDHPELSAGEGTRPPYRAFLLRCWQEAGAGSGSEPAWRFTLVHLEGGRVLRGFASLENLMAYLHTELVSPGGLPAGGG